jgi:Rad52/22 family double-strand break repair protein
MANLPTLKELHLAPDQAFKSDALNVLLNQPVPQKWVKDHPMAAGVKYLPIDKVEFMLTRIFQEWKVEVVNYAALFQSVSVHVRLHYKNPITGEWLYQDGLGAVAVQTDKGASAADLSKIKSDAIMKALPAAESYAIKDAAEKLGTIFGKNLNRKDAISFEAGSYSGAFESLDDIKTAIYSEFTHIKSVEDLEEYWRKNKVAFQEHDDIVSLFAKKRNEILAAQKSAKDAK